jgi:ribonuclease D
MKAPMIEPMSKQGTTGIPTKEQMMAMPPFPLLGRDKITLVSSAAQMESVCTALSGIAFCGFDTESKARFEKGEVSDGPHLIQLATLERAWVIQLYNLDCRSIILQWLRSNDIIKAGFGMADDCRQIERQFGVNVRGKFDLNAAFRKRGFSNDIGARRAVAIIFQQQLVKSKNISKSNWSKRILSENEVLYAANDAYVAAVIYDFLVSTGADRSG